MRGMSDIIQIVKKCTPFYVMKFSHALTEGVLIRRYKRFLADVRLPDGRVVTAHTPNTGSMRGCCTAGSRVWLSDSGNPKRKYPLNWELVEAEPGVIVGINTGLPNTLVREAIENGVIRELQGYRLIRNEVPYGNENSRIDLLLENGTDKKCFVEIKNVTMAEEGTAFFPDAVSLRGTRHLRELAGVVEENHRGVIFYCVQRKDVREVKPADEIDPRYGQTLREVIRRGVEAMAYQVMISTAGISLDHAIPVVCDPT